MKQDSSDRGCSWPLYWPSQCAVINMYANVQTHTFEFTQACLHMYNMYKKGTHSSAVSFEMFTLECFNVHWVFLAFYIIHSSVLKQMTQLNEL